MTSSSTSSKFGRESARPPGQGPGQLDSSLCEEQEKLVEEMTHSGRPVLEEKPLKQLKKICRTSDAYVEHAFNLLSSQLMEEHAEIRLSSFQIMNELFSRSHRFRELLVADMQEFLDLTLETTGDNPLPPPKAAAKLLKEQTLKAIQEWNAKYGKAYKKLALGYGYLKYNKMVDFANLEAMTAAEQRRQAARQAKIQLALAQRISKTLNDMDETIPEMNECLTQIENCFELLLPHPARYSDPTFPPQAVVSTAANIHPTDQGGHTTCSEGMAKAESKEKDCRERSAEMKRNEDSGLANDQSKESDDDDDDSHSLEEEGRMSPVHDGKDDALLQQHGLQSWNYNIDININTDGVMLEEDEDNQAILTTLEDMNRLIMSAYLPRLAAWIEVFNKSGKHEQKIKRCLDLKQALKGAAAKYAELNIYPDESSTRRRQSSVNDDGGGDSESEGEGFEDVPEKEGFEPNIPDHLREEYGLEPLPSTSQEQLQTSLKQESQKDNQNPSASTSKTVSRSAASNATNAEGVEVWHPLREAKHVLSDPTSQAGTILEMKKRLMAIRDMQLARKRKSCDSPKEELTSEKRQRLELLAKAPVVPFGVDLEHWANPEKIEAPTVVLADTAQRVWCSSAPDEVKIMEAAKDSLTTRVFNYTGEFQPVKWTCRAPMPSGKLCQRMDRYKCPFHGKIIPRDDQGNPEKVSDKIELLLTEEQKKQAKSLLNEVEIQQDIEAGLGLDLGGSTSSGKGKGDKKGKGKTKKYPNLTDLKKKSNTSIKRLEKRVLNKRALQRVANAMNRLEQRRYNDKFSNNFNYR